MIQDLRLLAWTCGIWIWGSGLCDGSQRVGLGLGVHGLRLGFGGFGDCGGLRGIGGFGGL